MPSIVAGDIKAPPDTVYDLMANVLDWGNWRAKDPKVRSENSPVNVGDEFNWSAGAPIKSKVTEAERGKAIAWTGSSLGLLKAHHRWGFTATEDGTHVTCEETISGLIAIFLRGSLDKINSEWLSELKKAAESA